jgi:hypothetical protein
MIPDASLADVQGRRYTPAISAKMSSDSQGPRFNCQPTFSKPRDTSSSNSKQSAVPEIASAISQANGAPTISNTINQATSREALPQRQNSFKRRRTNDKMVSEDPNAETSEDNVLTQTRRTGDGKFLTLDDDATLAHHMWAYLSKRENTLDDGRRLWLFKFKAIKAMEDTFRDHQESLKRREANLLSAEEAEKQREARIVSMEKEIQTQLKEFQERENKLKEITAQLMRDRERLSSWKEKLLHWARKDDTTYERYFGTKGSKLGIAANKPAIGTWTMGSSYSEIPNAVYTVANKPHPDLKSLADLYKESHVIGLPGPKQTSTSPFAEGFENQFYAPHDTVVTLEKLLTIVTDHSSNPENGVPLEQGKDKGVLTVISMLAKFLTMKFHEIELVPADQFTHAIKEFCARVDEICGKAQTSLGGKKKKTHFAGPAFEELISEWCPNLDKLKGSEDRSDTVSL